MRQQIAAANWKMNCTLDEANNLLQQLSKNNDPLSGDQEVVIAVPFPFLLLAKDAFKSKTGYKIAAQNCSDHEAGAFTGEVSVPMIKSCGATHVIIGHSERREYFHEESPVLAQKVSMALLHGLTPIFCCGEALDIREQHNQNEYVERQIEDGLFHLDAAGLSKVVIAYEPIWAIGTGKTATSEQAQEMHAHIRGVIARKFESSVASRISILYGGSVKASNAAEIFSKPDVDGGLVGGASLKAEEFRQIIGSLK